MRLATAWVLLSSLFAAANVVAAGVMLILGRALQMLFPDAGATVPIMYAAGAAGALAAIAFLRGALAAAPLGRKFYTRS